MFHIGFRTQIKILKRTDNALSCTKNFRMSIQQVIAHTEKKDLYFPESGSSLSYSKIFHCKNRQHAYQYTK